MDEVIEFTDEEIERGEKIVAKWQKMFFDRRTNLDFVRLHALFNSGQFMHEFHGELIKNPEAVASLSSLFPNEPLDETYQTLSADIFEDDSDEAMIAEIVSLLSDKLDQKFTEEGYLTWDECVTFLIEDVECLRLLRKSGRFRDRALQILAESYAAAYVDIKRGEETELALKALETATSMFTGMIRARTSRALQQVA